MNTFTNLVGRAWHATWQREPVVTLAVVQAALGVAVAFGVDLTGEQVGQLMALSAAILGFVARRQVSPVVPPPPPHQNPANVDAT